MTYPIVFVAGFGRCGTSMMMQMLKFEPQNKVTLLYANKTAENIIFKAN
jgi:ferredoxin-NADP reductase